METRTHPYVYVFIRTDLSDPQIAVQSCHSIVEATHAFDLGNLPTHPSIIILGVKDQNRLEQARLYLTQHQIQYVAFREPDIDWEMTALATGPIFGEKRKLFKKFELLRERRMVTKQA